MIQKMSTKILLFTLFTYVLASCSSYDKLLKSSDNELKYEMAVKYYEQKDYFRALQLFDELVPVYRGTAKAEKIYPAGKWNWGITSLERYIEFGTNLVGDYQLAGEFVEAHSPTACVEDALEISLMVNDILSK